jgi:CubicO group peptidase (beta-lactamase class C family)
MNPMPLQLHERLVELIDEHGVPGASVSVLVDGEITDASAGVVNVRTGVEVQPDSPFMIQSTTKVWTATLVMQLVDEGLVELDAPVTRYLPGFQTANRRTSLAITIRHLLTHTGGFEGDIWAPTSSGEDALERFVAEHVSQADQHSEPGRFFSYCSAGVGVLGRVIEELRGTTYNQALRCFLTDPLGLDDVVVDVGEAPAYRTAIGHVSAGPGAPLRPLRTWAVMPPSNPAAGNQLAMSARGLTTFARMHAADGLAPDGTRLLSVESARLMREPHVDIRPLTARSAKQGLGWRLTAEPHLVEHGGDAPGCGCMFQLVPDQGVAVAGLANGGDMAGLFAKLSEQLLSDLAGLSPPARRLVPDAAPVVDVDRYRGRYELRNQTAEVTIDESGRLWLAREERNDAVTMATLAGEDLEPQVCELRRAEGETFVCLDADGRSVGAVEFIDTNPEGRARYLHDGRAAPRVA